ncbi:MAG: IreB family regulatory phosphoprotein [Turicibacter sp.]|nr:IreB family regulatory phosphoprotein [Turicibacter sp.]
MKISKFTDTQKINPLERAAKEEVRDILMDIYTALKDKGYNPINQIVGYILSGDPTYITSHMNARTLITKLERDELLEEIVWFYLSEEI